MQGVIHYNQHLSHQCEHAQAFKACGFEATPTLHGDADVHVISGPWYALNHYRNHDRVLMIDRALWDDPNSVSIGWLQPDGSRRFAQGSAPRPKPEMRDWKQPWSMGELSCLILADYGQDVDDIADQARQRFVQTEVRRHPADPIKGKFDNIPLALQVTWYDCVICTGSTAVFEAIKAGIPAICLEPSNPCAPVCGDSIDGEVFRGDRSDWLHEISYTQFTLAEIADGTAWNLLKDIQ